MKLLIADDMRPVHTYLENAADFRRFGFDTVLHAYNGEECMALVRAERPALVLLDMVMPLMTGIDVFQRMNELPCEDRPLVVVLSAYDRFEYLHQALQSSAFDYLLKPIDVRTLHQTLGKAAAAIRERATRELGWYLFEPERGVSACALSLLGLKRVFLSYWQVAGGASDDAPGDAPDRVAVFKLGHREFAMLHDALRQSPREVARQIKSDPRLAERFAVEINEAEAETPAQLLDALAQCRKTLGSSFSFYNSSPLIDRRSVQRDLSSKLDQHRTKIAQILLENRDPRRLSQCLDRLFSDLAASPLDPAAKTDVLRGLLAELFEDLFASRAQQGADAPGELPSLDADASLEEQETVVTGYLRRLLPEEEPTAAEAHVAHGEEIERVMGYVRENYCNNFTLEHLAALVYMSKYNLCRQFKQRYGVSIWNCIKQLRLSRAHALLRDTDMKIYEIAVTIGYADASYFSNLFRAEYGVSPQQFRGQIAAIPSDR